MAIAHDADSGKRLLWAAATTGNDHDLIETAARAFGLAVRFCAPKDLSDLLRPGADDLVGIELAGDPRLALNAVRELHARIPAAPIIALSHDADVEVMRAALQAGASDFLALPLGSHEFHKALLRLTQVAARSRPGSRSGQVIAVYGVRGGLGATTIAVNLAVRLAALTKAEIGLVDLDLQRGDAAAFVNLVPLHSLATIASAPGEVDEIFLASTLTRHPSGVSILAAPATIEEADSVSEREVEVALRLFRSQFSYTIIDTPRAITGTTLTGFAHADRILVLTDLSVPSARAARRTFELLGRMEIPLERVELLVTEIVAGPLDMRKAAQVIGKEAFAIIPRDDAAGAAMNDGVPLNGRPARLTAAIEDLATKLAGLRRSSARSGLLQRIFPKGARP
jgi:pilus assembly protein CpaE